MVGAACSLSESKTSISPAFLKPMTVAVAPILNFSGEFQLDPIKSADLLASELTYVDGLTVLPVNRVVATLAADGKSQIESPEHALHVAEAVGADAIIVAGITEYDAYTPSVGLVLQMYTVQEQDVPGINAMEFSRRARPMALASSAQPVEPTSQVQLVLSATHEKVREAVEAFAAPRQDSEIHLGWRQYLKVQTLYLRFCWHEAIGRLMEQERSRRLRLYDDAARNGVPG